MAKVIGWIVGLCNSVFRNIFGLHLTGFSEGKHGYSTFTWLFGQFLAQSIAVGAFERLEAVQPFTFCSYLVLALIVVGGMVIMLRAEKDNGTIWIHAFDEGSIVFGRWILAWTLIIAIGFSVALAAGAFRPIPDLIRHFLEISSVKDATWLDETDAKLKEGIKFDVTLAPADLGDDGIPPKLTMLIAQSGALANDWRVERVDGFTLDADGKEHSMFPPPAAERLSTNPKYVELRELAPMFTYRFRIYLHRNNTDGMSRASAKELIKDAALKVFVQEPG